MTRPSPRKVGKARGWEVLDADTGKPVLFQRHPDARVGVRHEWPTREAARSWCREWHTDGPYRIVRYVPSLPRKAGPRRGK